MKNITVLYFFLILNSLALFSCSQESEIAVLESRINELESVVEQHQEKKLSNFLAKDFLATNNLNKSQFMFYIYHQLKRNKNISIVILNKEMVKQGNYFDVTLQVLLLGSNNLLPERGQTYRVNSKWDKEDGVWKISQLRWEKLITNE